MTLGKITFRNGSNILPDPRFITKPLVKLIDWFFHFTGNFGLAILIVTVLIKLVFFSALPNKSYASMAKMKAVQPEMAALRERRLSSFVAQSCGEPVPIPDQVRDRLSPDCAPWRRQDEAAASAESSLTKKEKINPLAGCLPIVVQIPVFFALYKVLFVATGSPALRSLVLRFLQIAHLAEFGRALDQPPLSLGAFFRRGGAVAEPIDHLPGQLGCLDGCFRDRCFLAAPRCRRRACQTHFDQPVDCLRGVRYGLLSCSPILDRLRLRTIEADDLLDRAAFRAGHLEPSMSRSSRGE
jgi:YidC/Oxa1 family membrane protein insertase